MQCTSGGSRRMACSNRPGVSSMTVIVPPLEGAVTGSADETWSPSDSLRQHDLVQVPRVLLSPPRSGRPCLSNGTIAAKPGGVMSKNQSSGEAFTEKDGELSLGHHPLTRRHFPLLLRALQGQEQELHCGLVDWEVTSGPDSAAEFSVEASTA